MDFLYTVEIVEFYLPIQHWKTRIETDPPHPVIIRPIASDSFTILKLISCDSPVATDELHGHALQLRVRELTKAIKYSPQG